MLNADGLSEKMITTLLSRFPKTRLSLPEEYAEIYQEHYRANRDGSTPISGITSRLEGWMHRRVARSANMFSGPTLEIGAGNLNHLNYEQPGTPYDIVEPAPFLYQVSDRIGRVRNFYSDIREVSRENAYTRVISIATFEHITDLPSVIAAGILMLDPQGIMDIAIPSEGEALWKLGWMLTSGIEFRKRYGLDYELLMRYEHVNSAREIEQLLHYFFRQVKVTNFGFSRSLSIYQHLCCSGPNRTVAANYLATLTDCRTNGADP